MPTIRVQVVMEESEQELYRREAEASGQSLSGWLRSAARDKLAVEKRRRRIGTAAELQEFFSACDTREVGDEPSWEAHRAVIEASRARGTSPT